MKRRRTPVLFAIGSFSTVAASFGRAPEPALDRMPAALETQFALSAAPLAMRDRATVYLLDPGTGYRLSRQGASGVTCLVERTAWELADFRDDIYAPLCYDAAGAKTYLQVVMDAAALRARGVGPPALKTEIERRYANKRYHLPAKPGVSYMVAPVMRTVGPPDLKVRTMSMPHLMFYAPYVTNADIGAVPDFTNHASLLHPFIMKEGTAEQSYVIQLVGDAERAGIVTGEHALLDALCAYRDVLCLTGVKH